MSAPTREDSYAVALSIWRHLAKTSGHQMFGYDWITLSITRPQLTGVLGACYENLGVTVPSYVHAMRPRACEVTA